MARLPASLHRINTPLSAADLKKMAKQLEDLQGNILKGFGRHHTAHLFLKFKAGKKNEAHKWIKTWLKPRLTTAAKQLADRA